MLVHQESLKGNIELIKIGWKIKAPHTPTAQCCTLTKMMFFILDSGWILFVSLSSYSFLKRLYGCTYIPSLDRLGIPMEYVVFSKENNIVSPSSSTACNKYWSVPTK